MFRARYKSSIRVTSLCMYAGRKCLAQRRQAHTSNESEGSAIEVGKRYRPCTAHNSTNLRTTEITSHRKSLSFLDMIMPWFSSDTERYSNPDRTDQCSPTLYHWYSIFQPHRRLIQNYISSLQSKTSEPYALIEKGEDGSRAGSLFSFLTSSLPNVRYSFLELLGAEHVESIFAKIEFLRGEFLNNVILDKDLDGKVRHDLYSRLIEVSFVALCSLAGSESVSLNTFKGPKTDSTRKTPLSGHYKRIQETSRAHQKRVLRGATQLLHDALQSDFATHKVWLCYFALWTEIEHDTRNYETFWFWVRKYLEWLQPIRTEKNETGNGSITCNKTEGIKSISSAGSKAASVHSEREIFHSDVSALLCLWCGARKPHDSLFDNKNIVQLWFQLFPGRIHELQSCEFRPTLSAYAAALHAVGTSADGGFRSALISKINASMSQREFLCSSWSIILTLLSSLTPEDATQVVYSKIQNEHLDKVSLREKTEGESHSQKDSKQDHSRFLRFPVLYSLLHVYVLHRRTTEAEALFLRHVAPQEHVVCSTLFSPQQVSKLSLLMLRLYSSLRPFPDLQTALNVRQKYVCSSQVNAQHYVALLNCARMDRTAGYALFIEACSLGISLPHEGYDALYRSLGGMSLESLARGYLPDYGDYGPSVLDEYMHVPGK